MRLKQSFKSFQQVAYELDEALIDVGVALEKCELDNAFCALDPLELTVETQLMWKQVWLKEPYSEIWHPIRYKS